jgi:hypothetical protein
MSREGATNHYRNQKRPSVTAHISEETANEIFNLGLRREELAEQIKRETDPVKQIPMVQERRSLRDKALAERYKIPLSIVRRCITGV